MADYKTPQWLLPNEKNLAYPAAGDGVTGSGLSEDRHSLYSMDFDGSNYIDLGTGLDIFRYNINESYSVSLWYKATVSGGFKTIINLGANNYRFCLLSATLGRITFGAGNSTTITVTYNWLPTAGAINDGQWHHICIVQDSSGGVPNLTAYVDGSSSGSSAGATPAITQNNNRIGDGHYGGVEAGIDEVAIFNYALNATEVAALSVADAPANLMALSAKPIAYYPLGEQAQMGSANWSFPNGSLQSHAIDFDGSNDYINLNSIDLGTTNTISFWHKRGNTTSNQHVLGSPDGTQTYIIYFTSGYIYIRPDGSTQFLSPFLGNSPYPFPPYKNTTDWANYIVTRNGDTIKLYLNGVEFALSGSGTGMAATTINAIANKGVGVSNTLDGELSNVVVWNSDQSANVTNIYNNGSPQSTYTTTPNNWWKLNAANSSYDTATSTWTFTDGPGTNDGTSTTLPSTALVTSDLQFESPYSNYSLSFDGTSNFMGTTESILPSAGDMTVSAWVKFNDTTSLQGIFESANYYTTGFNGGFGLRANGVGLSAAFSNGTSFVYNIEPAGFTIGDWFHVAFTFNNTSKLGTYYVNGLSIGTHTFNSAYDNADLVNGAELGRVVKNSGYILNGNLDEVSVFSSVLTQAQITQIYNNSYPADLTSLSPASWWRLGEDAYFVSNTVTIPNKVVGGATMTGNGTQTAILVGNAPGSYANGSGTNLVVTDRIGDAPESTANSVSINMIPSNRHSYTAGYVPTQVDNVYSMEFDGLNDYFDIGNLQPSTTSLSISAWAYKTDTSQASIIGRGASVDYGIFVYGGSLQFGLNSGSWSTITTSIPTVNTWFHVCATWDGTSMKLYVNGALASSASKTGTITYTSNNTTIGKNSTLSGFEWDGKIDEVALFNYALSERQIKQDIYEGTTTGKTADLNNISNLTAPVAWYRMGD